ncbi:transposase for insertion sequence element ISRM3 [Trichonephila clavata]|uniref:Transposase for insertion sequence element ISRM3 n=1 Tax=Trichonephila clavata TaxID=2740835 RepID=A0A8X6F2Y4_TRICU|nr:transposase for insertion sequence element ISRM3 [Trichonephila clavata]
MSEKIANNYVGLVNYQELESNILSSIREDGALTPLIKKLLEASLEGEMESHLSNNRNEENNRRNGKNSKTLRTSSGSFELLTPRDREGSFEPQIVKKRQTNLHPELETKILSTFASGMGYRDIVSHVEEIYDHKISAAEISSIDQNGKKEVLGFYLAESEGANFWLGVLNDLKERGVEDILIACVDGLESFPAAINSVFPNAEVQMCIVHQIRNSLKYVASKDAKSFLSDLKKVYQASSKKIAENYLLELDEKWGTKYPMVLAE